MRVRLLPEGFDDIFTEAVSIAGGGLPPCLIIFTEFLPRMPKLYLPV